MFWFTRKRLVGSYFSLMDADQVVVDPVGRPDPVLALIAQIIHIDAALQERLHRLEERPRPAEYSLAESAGSSHCARIRKSYSIAATMRGTPSRPGHAGRRAVHLLERRCRSTATGLVARTRSIDLDSPVAEVRAARPTSSNAADLTGSPRHCRSGARSRPSAESRPPAAARSRAAGAPLARPLQVAAVAGPHRDAGAAVLRRSRASRWSRVRRGQAVAN